MTVSGRAILANPITKRQCVALPEQRAHVRQRPREREYLEAVGCGIGHAEISWRYHVPQVFFLWSEEAALLEPEEDAGTSQQAQESVEVRCRLCVRARKHDSVIEIEWAYLPADFGKDNIQCALEGVRCIFQSDKHTQVAKMWPYAS